MGITISKDQANYAREICKGLNVEIRLQDYRSLKENEKFDRIVSVGMTEHIGEKNYREFFRIVHKNLKEDGIYVMHTIGASGTQYLRTGREFDASV